MERAIQDVVNPDGVCFGCGPANAQGLHIKTYPDPDGVHYVATVVPDERYCGWPGLVYGRPCHGGRLPLQLGGHGAI